MKRTGLKRLECATCAGYVYATVANLELVGLPACACGERLHPVDLDLALALDDDDARPVIEYRYQLNRVAHGQAPHGRRGVALRAVEEIAAERVEAQRASTARARRIGALKPTPEPLPF